MLKLGRVDNWVHEDADSRKEQHRQGVYIEINDAAEQRIDEEDATQGPKCQHALSYSAALLLLLSLWGNSLVYGEYVNQDLMDPRSSGGKSGIDTPREYYIPPSVPYEKVDFHEFSDYHKTIYSPYAQLQLAHPIQVGTVILKEGYYLVKLDIVDPPPRPITYSAASKAPSEVSDKSNVSLLEKFNHFFGLDESNQKESTQRRKQFPPLDPDSSDPYERPTVSLLIKQMGSVELIIPIYSSEPLIKRIKKGSKAELVAKPGDPLRPQLLYLKYCVSNICYNSAPLEPGLIQ